MDFSPRATRETFGFATLRPMPANMREIKGRIKAVGNIQRITKTMQMIATARFQALSKRATDAQDYARKMQEVVGKLAAATTGELTHPLLSPPEPEVGRELLLVLTSDRGLCGAYNANVIREAMRHLQETTRVVELHVVGKKGVGVLKFSGRSIDKVHEQFGDKPAYLEVQKVAESYMQRFAQGEFDAVRVASMDYLSRSKQVARVKTLLPIEPPQAVDQDQDASTTTMVYAFSPDPQTLLEQVLPETVKIRLFQFFNEAVVSEQIARMMAMQSATDSAGKQKKQLKRQFNRARQTAITTELSEIIGGAAALE